MDWQQAQQELTQELTPLHGEREAAVIADWVMEHLTGKKRPDRLINKNQPLTSAQNLSYKQYLDQLLRCQPVQYVLNESWFYGMRLYVDPAVLIPRPETEELVEWVLETIRTFRPQLATPLHPTSSPVAAALSGPPAFGDPVSLLDVGTGSGCIAIAIAKHLPNLQVHACDVSTDALAVAKRNATDQQVDIRFHHLDFLDPQQRDSLPLLSWLVSNPPYIPVSERTEMAAHVTEAEPSLALFVPDSDPLLFYRTLADFALEHLAKEGLLFAEIHEAMGNPVKQLLQDKGFKDIVLRQDLNGRDRMIKATR